MCPIYKIQSKSVFYFTETIFDKVNYIFSLIYNWDNVKKINHIKTTPEYTRKHLGDEYLEIDIHKLTKSELKILNFWERRIVNSEKIIFMIPLWLVEYLPKNINTIDINGLPYTKKVEIDIF